MQPDEKADLSLFGAASRRRVADEVGCNLTQVNLIVIRCKVVLADVTLLTF